MNPRQARGPRRPRPRSSRPPSTCSSSRRASSSTASSRSSRGRSPHCVRCGKCKPDCCVYHPARGMFFHPRNKNLAIGVAHRGAPLRRAARALDALRAAPLARGRRRPLHHLPQVPEALPGRHRLGRGLDPRARHPRSRGATRTRPSRRARRSATSTAARPRTTRSFRSTVVRLGGALQRASPASSRRRSSPRTGGPAPYALQMLRSPVPAGSRRRRCGT